MQKFEIENVKRWQITSEMQNLTRQWMKSLLTDNNVKFVKLEYDGGGDESNYIEIQFADNDYFDQVFSDNEIKFLEDIEFKINDSIHVLKDYLNDWMFNWSCIEYNGHWNGGGARGSVIWDIENDDITLSHLERFEDYHEYEASF